MFYSLELAQRCIEMTVWAGEAERDHGLQQQAVHSCSRTCRSNSNFCCGVINGTPRQG